MNLKLWRAVFAIAATAATGAAGAWTVSREIVGEAASTQVVAVPLDDAVFAVAQDALADVRVLDAGGRILCMALALDGVSSRLAVYGGARRRPEMQTMLLKAVDGLPEELRVAITLREVDGLSYEEIAQKMDCPIGTVRSRIFRAREAIDVELRPLLDVQSATRERNRP